MLNRNVADVADIHRLETLAAEVKMLKELHRQKRPLILEFCGSPKSGKTSCINSLNIFLKRNGFKTAIITERASVCPISDKLDPNFNVWTATSAINEMNRLIDGKSADIIICDRGIFDALCWFNWLKTIDKMDELEYDTIADFVMLDRWQNKIDLVYVFVASPETSIEREYATLLTQKRGSIMREPVLEQYRKAIDDTYEEFCKQFRATQLIDTSEKRQNEVSLEVTNATLSTLKNLLMEKIGYYPSELLELDYGFNDCIILEEKYSSMQFDLRNKVDYDDRYVQPIPIAVITNPDQTKVLCLKKTEKSTSKSSPESGKMLLYAGGHIRAEDAAKSFIDTAKKTLKRELKEELNLINSLQRIGLPFLLYTPDTPTSKCHMAVGWIVEIGEDEKFNLDAYEIVQKKGTSKSGTFLPLSEMTKDTIELESWSREILLNFFSDRLNKEFRVYLEKAPKQMTL